MGGAPDIEKVNDYERVCKEWLKGCSCSIGYEPEYCEECTENFHKAIKALTTK